MLIDTPALFPLTSPTALQPLSGPPLGDDLGWLPAVGVAPLVECVDDPDAEDDDLGDEEDLSITQPLADEESSFDDFDDEFDDDFEEEENDPDWDHPDDADEEPPPAKGPGKKK